VSALSSYHLSVVQLEVIIDFWHGKPINFQILMHLLETNRASTNNKYNGT